MTNNRFFTSGFLCLFLITLVSCSKRIIPSQPYTFQAKDGKPDYANLDFWAAHPWKWDPSDSVPQTLRQFYHKDSLADVFFLYPTSLINFEDERWNAPADDAAINSKTDYSSILYQASAFSEKTRVFAPRYRQANLKSYYSADTLLSKKAFDLAYEDIKAAFVYYLKHYHSGRPIIIAAHSQGTTHAGQLLKDFFEGKDLQKSLVAAYLIGMPVPEAYFTTLKPCLDSTQTGCFVSWRTYKKGYDEPRYVAREKFKSIVTNPILWTNSNEYAPAKLNKGGVLTDFNRVRPGVVDAQVHGNVLWSSKPEFFGNFLLRTKNYHIADINFFYVNIAENVKTRIMFHAKTPGR